MNHYYTNNNDLASNKKSFDYYFDNEHFTFTTDIGVFSKKNVDYGSHLLLKNIYKRELGNDILDLGCGYGPIGIVIKHFHPEANVLCVDVNERAVDLANENAKINNSDIKALLCEDILSLNISFDSIILNPPIRAGKTVIYGLYKKSHQIIRDGGSLYIVIQKKQGAQSSISELQTQFKEVIVLDRDSGYYTIKATK